MKSKLVFLFALALIVLTPALCLAEKDSVKKGEETTDIDEPAKKSEAPDIFDFKGAPPSEQDPEDGGLALDERIAVKVEPIVRNAVVDRVIEPARIKVKAPPGFFKVEIYLEPVDAPFGGKSLGEPKLLGHAKGSGNFTFFWNGPESHEYVKLFVLAYKPGSTHFSTAGRSHAIDLAIGGTRLQPNSESVPAAAAPQ